MEWIWNNKEWIFSGIGVTAVFAVLALFQNIRSKKKLDRNSDERVDERVSKIMEKLYSGGVVKKYGQDLSEAEEKHRQELSEAKEKISEKEKQVQELSEKLANEKSAIEKLVIENLAKNQTELTRIELDEILRSSRDLSGRDCSNFDFSEMDLERVNFQGCNLLATKFRKTNLKHTNFNYSNLERADLSFSDIKYSNFSAVNLWGGKITGVKNINAIFSGEYLNLYDIRESGKELELFKTKSDNILSLPDYGTYMNYFCEKFNLKQDEYIELFSWMKHKHFIDMFKK